MRHGYRLTFLARRAAQAVREFIRDRTGAAMVEFMLVSTVVFFPMVYGIIEFGRGTWAKTTVTAAAREGARFAIVRGADSAKPATTDTVAAYVQGRSRLSPLIVVATWPTDNKPGSSVKVKVSYVYTPIISSISTVLKGKQIKIPFLTLDTLTSTSTQMIQY